MKTTKTHSNKRERFVPNIENFKTSLRYEGLKMKESTEKQSITSLKRKLRDKNGVWTQAAIQWFWKYATRYELRASLSLL